jgi:hypothetical protein
MSWLIERKENSSGGFSAYNQERLYVAVFSFWEFNLPRVISVGILTYFPFVLIGLWDFSEHLGPTNSCMIANRKKTFPTTIFKALQTRKGCVVALPRHIPYPVWIIATITEICTNNRSTCFHNLDKLPRNCKRHPTLCIFTTINAEVREKLHIWAPSIFRATPFDS